MSHQDIFENRKQFQLERLILFSDAVFAIAITLLVIEIKVPAGSWSDKITAANLNEYLLEILPHIFGFVISFFVIGFYWSVHHRMFGYVISYDSRLIWLNLLLLFFIAFLPFTTSLTSEYGYLNESFIFYWLNVGFIGLLGLFIQVHISNPKKNLSVGLEDKNKRHYYIGKSLVSTIVFFLGAVFSFCNNDFLQSAAQYIYILIFPGMLILKKIYGIKK